MKTSKLLIYFCGYGLLISSVVKFLAFPRVVNYLSWLGFSGGRYRVVEVVELSCAIMFLVPATRFAGLLLVSAYLGAAVSAHLAEHPAAVGGPFIQFMSDHPIVGAFYPGIFLMAAWLGMWLQRGKRFG